jgi:hypothetical protein
MDSVVERLSNEIEKINHTLYTGNGQPAMTVQLATLNKEMASVKKSLEIDLEKILNMKFKCAEETTQVKLNELKIKLLNVQQQMDEGFKQINNQLYEFKENYERRNTFDWKFKLSWIAFAGTVLAAIFGNWQNIFVK